ncbi:MBL fold metallo-hydrolase [Umezawaea beigongshangensis]|uniref:MBL fold metallo-hydrolase n=1 Tax=Umezawaea beigongshangensis TaxID=2780383 RepID=UPI0018F16093|nr:MBL fold metallo-hydrolase [Umezawaea beigongshangensis]
MEIDFVRGAPVAGDLDVRWIHGAAADDPPVQVHEHDPFTVVLRQSMAVHHEAPFLVLFLGNARALLLDSGATADPALFPLRGTVDRLLREHLARHPRENYELVVAHTHAHSDHVAGDGQFADRPRTTVVGTDVAAVREFFGFGDDLDEVARFDLGGRVLDVVRCPGHHETSVALHDPWTGLLLTGDTVYPGRLYVRDAPAFAASLERLVAFADARAVTHVLGCHVEMSRRPGRDHPIGSTYQPDELPPQMTVDRLRAVRDAAVRTVDRPGVHVHEDFAIWNGPCRAALARHRVRAAWLRWRRRTHWR